MFYQIHEAFRSLYDAHLAAKKVAESVPINTPLHFYLTSVGQALSAAESHLAKREVEETEKLVQISLLLLKESTVLLKDEHFLHQIAYDITDSALAKIAPLHHL